VKREIQTESDVEEMVKLFYKKILDDETLASFFIDTNWEAHLPRMIQFWNFQLLNKPGFTGNVFNSHMNRNIKSEHFTRWLELFSTIINEHFIGEKAELAKQKAKELGMIFSYKLQTLEN